MKENPKKDPSKSGGVSIRAVGIVTIIIAIILAFYAFYLAGKVATAEDTVTSDQKRYVECSEAVDNLQSASDYLTSQARMFVTTGRREYMDAYIKEISVTDRRGKAVDVLRSSFSENREAVTKLEHALDASNGLAKSELSAFRLAAEYYGIDDVPKEVAEANTDLFRDSPSKETLIETAKSLVLSESYDNVKENISSSVRASSDALLERLNTDLEENKTLIQGLLFQLRVTVALLLCVIMVFVLALFMYVLKPLGRYIERLSAGEPLEPDGAYELHYLANAYNIIYEDNNQRIEKLREYAERDSLTGISNRGGYDNFLATHTRNIALLLIDINNFKEFNTVYGHDTGDAVLIKMAEALNTAFRSTDFPCRINGDLFAVVMTNMNIESRQAILNKVEMVNSILGDDSSDLPAVTLSVGAAFSTEDMSQDDIYHAAHAALQQAKQAKSNSVYFYGEGHTAQDEANEAQEK